MANRRNRRLPPRAPLRNNPQPTRRQPLLRKLTDSTSLQLQADGDCNYPVQYVDNRPGQDPATMPLSTRTCLPLAGITHTSTMRTTMRATSSAIKRHIHLRSRQSQTYRAASRRAGTSRPTTAACKEYSELEPTLKTCHGNREPPVRRFHLLSP